MDITMDQIKAAAEALCKDVPTVREAKGFTAAEMEAMYSLGFNFYNTGRFDDAEKVFKFLVMVDHLAARYWIALGAVTQVKKDYQKATVLYAYASFLDLSNPKPQYLAAECFAAMGDRVNALSALEALEMCADKESEVGRTYRAKAAALKARLAA